jgi:hypothetical protein
MKEKKDVLVVLLLWFSSLRLFQNFIFGKSLSLARPWADLSRGPVRGGVRRLAVALFLRGLGAGFRELAGWWCGIEGDFG